MCTTEHNSGDADVTRARARWSSSSGERLTDVRFLSCSRSACRSSSVTACLRALAHLTGSAVWTDRTDASPRGSCRGRHLAAYSPCARRWPQRAPPCKRTVLAGSSQLKIAATTRRYTDQARTHGETAPFGDEQGARYLEGRDEDRMFSINMGACTAADDGRASRGAEQPASVAVAGEHVVCRNRRRRRRFAPRRSTRRSLTFVAAQAHQARHRHHHHAQRNPLVLPGGWRASTATVGGPPAVQVASAI